MIGLLCFVLAVLASPFKSKSRLEAENAALRHQLIVLRRKMPGRPWLTNNESSDSAPIRQLQPATNRIRCTRWLAVASSSCAFPIRWGSLRRTLMAELTIRALAGRDGRCG